jgi:hypothetical protein
VTKAEVKVTFPLAVSQPWYRVPFVTHDQFLVTVKNVTVLLLRDALSNERANQSWSAIHVPVSIFLHVYGLHFRPSFVKGRGHCKN